MKINFRKIFGSIGTGLMRVIQGDTVNSRFLKRHFFVTTFAVITCMLFIAARFEYATGDRDIRKLNKQIERARTEKQREISRYHTLTRESTMRHLVDSLHLGLDVPDATPNQRPGSLTLD